MASTAVLRPTLSHHREGPLLSSMPGASLVFDIEVEDPQHENVKPAKTCQYLAALKERLAYFAKPSGDFAGKLLRDVRHFKRAVLLEENEPDTILLATKLSNVGYSVVVRAALGGGAACFRNLRHEFLSVRGSGDYEGVEYIVEPRFREQFLISHPTEEYSELLEHVPDVFVGTSSRLIPVVQVLCAEMADSFQIKNLTLPPWRRTQSMLSKWMPNKARDTSFCRLSDPLPEPSNPFTRISDPTHLLTSLSSSELDLTSRALSVTAYTAGTISTTKSQQPNGKSPQRSLLSFKLQCSDSQEQKSAVGTVPPCHWGELPIHKVKMGFQQQ